MVRASLTVFCGKFFLRIFFIVHDSVISLNAQLSNLRFPSV